MIGSTFIFETDLARLATVETKTDALDELTIVELDSMITVDFESLCGHANLKWVVGEPVIFNEENGISLFQVSPEGLKHVLEGRHDLEKQQLEDISQLRAFVHAHGTSHIYELATF